MSIEGFANANETIVTNVQAQNTFNRKLSNNGILKVVLIMISWKCTASLFSFLGLSFCLLMVAP